MAKLTANQTIKLLESDPKYLVRFILDNNLNAVVQNLKAEGIEVPANYDNKAILNIVHSMFRRGRKARAIKVLSVNYDASSGNYTAGFGDYFDAIKQGVRPLSVQDSSVSPSDMASGTPVSLRNSPVDSAELVGDEAAGGGNSGFGMLLLNTIGTVATAAGSIWGQPQQVAPPPSANKIMGMNKGLFFGLLAVVGIVLFIYFRKKNRG